MSKVLKTFEWKSFGGGAKHPWDVWMDGSIHQLDASDYGECKPQTLQMMARKQARKRGLALRVSMNTEEGIIVMQTFEPPDEYDSKEARAEAWRKEDAAKAAAKEARAAQSNGQEPEQEDKEDKEEDKPTPKKGRKGSKK
jgi:hypothetical protein